MPRAVFLDRDGVINRAIVCDGKPYPPENIASLEILPQVPEALALLKKAGFLLIVVTNQPDVARGKITRDDVETIHQHMASILPIDAFFTCYHDDADNCQCRKPKPGALLAAADQYKIDLQNSFMVGDRWRDVEAGTQAGCRTIFIDYGYAEKQPSHYWAGAGSLIEATISIIKHNVEK